MKISREAKKITRELFQLSFVNGKLDAQRVSEVSDKIVATKPRSYVAILKEYTRLIRLELAKRHAIVESAVALDPAASQKIEGDIRAKFGADITTEFRTEPGLIGGIRIKVGSEVWDGSVRSRLQTLTNQI